MCSAALPKGSEAWWDSDAKKAWCTAHGDSSPPSVGPVDPGPPVEGPADDQTGLRRLKVRYTGNCARCRTELPAKVEAFWDRSAKQLICLACEAPSAASPATPTTPLTTRAADDLLGTRPGGSAAAEYEKRRLKEEEGVRNRFGRFPRLAELIIKVTEETADTAAWGKGARGEAALGTALGSISGVQVLHDRLRPKARAANIDHIVVAPTGVWVIDAKHYSGKVEQVNRGTFFRPVHHLKVGGRRCDDLAEKVDKQVAAVTQALESAHPGVRVQGVLCFIGTEWDFLAPPFDQNGILVIWPKKLYKMLAQPGPLDSQTIRAVHQTLSRALPPAVHTAG